MEARIFRIRAALLALVFGLGACTLQIPDSPEKTQLPSCDAGTVLYSTGRWTCATADELPVTNVVQADRAGTATSVGLANTAAHANSALVAQSVDLGRRYRLGFDGQPAFDLDVRGGAITVEGFPVEAEDQPAVFDLSTDAVSPGNAVTWNPSQPVDGGTPPLTFSRPMRVHVEGNGTIAGDTLSGSTSPVFGRCKVELGVLATATQGSFQPLATAVVSTFSTNTSQPSSVFLEGEAVLDGGTYSPQLRVTNLASAGGTNCVPQPVVVRITLTDPL